MSTVCVVGLGYIGLPVASVLASRGHEVTGFDVNAKAVESVAQGRAHFFEPDLDMLLDAAVKTGRLKAQTKPAEAQYYILAVPTPFRDGHKPDLSYVDAATRSIAPTLKAGATVILESTSPVGTTERVAKILSELRSDLRFPVYKDDVRPVDVHVAHCPERILPGQMVRELVANDRVIGGMTTACAKAAEGLYKSFVTAQCYITDCRVAEFVKLIENSYRDVNIAFANELSIICDKLDVDVWAAIELANKHPRVSILKPGAGVGGHCIAVDPWFIVDSAPAESRLIKMARDVNNDKPVRLVKQILEHADRFKNPVIGCFGVTYKPDVEDIRESPALDIVQHLAETKSCRLLVCDPTLKELPPSLKGNSAVKFVTMEEAVRDSDIAAFLVGHRQFKGLNVSQFMRKIVVDAIGLLSVPASAR